MGGANRSLDLPLVLAVVSVITVMVIVGNLLVDLVYGLLDPRIRYE
jgi:peptide/nickel transport system permease protein